MLVPAFFFLVNRVLNARVINFDACPQWLESIQKSNVDGIRLIPLQGIAIGNHHVEAGSVGVVDNVPIDTLRTARPQLVDGLYLGQVFQNGLALCFDVFGRYLRFEIKENRMQYGHADRYFD